MEAGSCVQNLCDCDNRVYIVVRGCLSIFIKNEQISDWDWAMDVYNSLKKWKKEVFDLKIKTAMRQHFEQFRIKFDMELNRRIRLRFKRQKSFKEE